MPYKVLVVDDSGFFQMRLKEMIELHADLRVIGFANNGQQAIEMEEELRPDVITMDYEMPKLDGVSAVKKIVEKKRHVPIVMFSSMTYDGAKVTLDAMEAGAVDFIAKNFLDVSRDSNVLQKKLHEKLLMFARRGKMLRNNEVTDSKIERPPSTVSTKLSGSENKPEYIKKNKTSLKSKIKLIIIGASTGGPQAITQIITQLPSDFLIPIVIIQHMPENFTKVFAERLDRQSNLKVKEAVLGDKLEVGQVLVAPGAKQLMFERGGKTVKIFDGDDRVNYKPSVDITFASAANVFSTGVLGIVLTGMGADGCEGARLLKSSGSFVWSQDQKSSTVFGMPAAVANAGYADDILSLEDFSRRMVSDI